MDSSAANIFTIYYRECECKTVPGKTSSIKSTCKKKINLSNTRQNQKMSRQDKEMWDMLDGKKRPAIKMKTKFAFGNGTATSS